jgi:hypothetical protein
MGTWSIIKVALEHCSGALLVCAIFSVTTYILGLLFPDNAVLWWIGKIDTVLAILTISALAIIFLASLGRLAYDAVVSALKGVSNGNAQSIFA